MAGTEPVQKLFLDAPMARAERASDAHRSVSYSLWQRPAGMRDSSTYSRRNYPGVNELHWSWDDVAEDMDLSSGIQIRCPG